MKLSWCVACITVNFQLAFLSDLPLSRSCEQVIYPLDVIRRWMQVGQNPANLAGSGRAAVAATKSTGGLVYHLRSLSPRQLYAGLTATYMKVMPAAAISLVCRDAILGRLS